MADQQQVQIIYIPVTFSQLQGKPGINATDIVGISDANGNIMYKISIQDLVLNAGVSFSGNIAGIAKPDTVPVSATPESQVIYIAGPGTYTSFPGADGQPIVTTANLNVISWDGTKASVQAVPVSVDLSGYTPTGGSPKTTLQVDKKDRFIDYSILASGFTYNNATGKLTSPNLCKITTKSGVHITIEGGSGVGLLRITDFVVSDGSQAGHVSNVYIDIPVNTVTDLTTQLKQNYDNSMPPIADTDVRILLGSAYTVSATSIDFYSNVFGIYANTGNRKSTLQLSIEANNGSAGAIAANTAAITLNTTAIATNANNIAGKLSHDVILETGINIFDKTKARRGGFLLADGITWHVQAGYDVSDFMKLEQAQTYCIGGDTGSYDQYAWSYKADKTLHTYYGIPTNPIPRKFVPATDEAYLKTATPTALYDTFMVAKSSTYPVSYIPYSEFIKPDLLPSPLPVIQKRYDIGMVDFQIPNTDFVDISDFGQSPSTGQQSYPSLTIQNFRGNKMIGDQVWLNYGGSGASVLIDLVSKRAASTIGLAKTRAAASQDEPPVISFGNAAKMMADRMNISNKSTFVVNSTGTDGKSIEQLLTSTYYDIFKNKLIKLKAIADGQSKSLSCPVIMFIQGEYNYYELGGSSDKDTYKANCLILKNKMQADVLSIYGQQSIPLFITYQTTGPYTHNKEVSIGMAQLEFALENPDVALACPSYNFSNRGAHMDANGYRWMGQQFAKAWDKILRGNKFLPLHPTRVIKESERQIRILFFVPVAPLAFDVNTVPLIDNNGFYVYNESGALSIKSTEIDGDSVLITLDADMTGIVNASYAPQAFLGRGNLRDSDQAVSMYNYIDLDGKDGGGNFIYPRDAGETTLRPDFEPKDESGLVIYNKPYPLYNFCVAFSMPVLY